MADSEGGSEQDDVSFLRTVSCIVILVCFVQEICESNRMELQPDMTLATCYFHFGLFRLNLNDWNEIDSLATVLSLFIVRNNRVMNF
jgi:hypothetical protein